MITQEELKNFVNYDPDTGNFTRIVRLSQNMRVGDIAGCKHHKKHNGKTYIKFRIKSKLYSAHRLAFLYMNGAFPSDQVDHINGDSCDNRWINLREVKPLENQRNLKKPKHNTSGTVGVQWHKKFNKWHARIQVMKKNMSLGLFENFEDAVTARKSAELSYGFHKNHGR